jgi:hypothetical protein
MDILWIALFVALCAGIGALVVGCDRLAGIAPAGPSGGGR